MRAFLAGKKNLPQAEAVQAVIEAGTDADLTAALAQLAGGVSRPLEALRDDLLNLLADVEAALDFADEHIEFVGKTDTLRRVRIGHRASSKPYGSNSTTARYPDGRCAWRSSVCRTRARAACSMRSRGAKAIVSPIPGTTRDYLTKSFSLAGIAVELIDTAGWLEALDTIEESRPSASAANRQNTPI